VGILRLSSVANTISFSYAPAAGSGTLTVSSGGQVVASIDMIGSYTSANFSITAGVGGTVAIVDPSVVNGRQCRDRAGKALPAARPRPAGHPLRRSNDAPHSELRNAGQLRATDGLRIPSFVMRDSLGRPTGATRTIAFLGSFMAGSFATTAGAMAAPWFQARP